MKKKMMRAFAASLLVAFGLGLSGCAGGHTTLSVGVGVGYPYGWGGMGAYGVGGGVYYGGYWR
jgi:hypothetical protein